MSAWQWAGLVLLALPVFWLLILLAFARQVRAAWREPVLRHPVLIIESDDWGPGPAHHAPALRRVAERLLKHRDATGRPAVMTLGLTLSLPDSQAIRAEGFPLTQPSPQSGEGFPLPLPSGERAGVRGHGILPYHLLPLTAPAYAGILAAIREGIQAGVFAPQLHGMAHYWPDALMRAAQTDPAVRDWILGGPGQETESLPSPLQSRWIDASVLPSRPLPRSEIEAAVAEEVALYRAVFGAPPAVAVPPTFIWTEAVEAAWAAQGVSCIVTPGLRHSARNADGLPWKFETEPGIHNGQPGIGSITYLVRDRYFEPSRGHRAEKGLAALAEKSQQGRPCLLETHRFNFTGEQQEDALTQLDQLLGLALKRHPNLRFASAAELADQYRQSGDWLAKSPSHKLAAWAHRMQSLPRFAKMARYSGLSLCLAALRLLGKNALQ